MSTSPTTPPSGGKLRPWKAVGMSRASWYRHGKPAAKPTRTTQTVLAKILDVSVRTIQRDEASMREEERQKTIARVREYMAQGYTQDEACELRAAELRASAIEGLISSGRLVSFAQASQHAAKMAQSRDDSEGGAS